MSNASQEQELSALRAEVAALKAQCADARRELEAFTYAVSHDLRAPLRSLSGFSQALLELPNENPDPKAAHYLDRIQQAGRKLSEMIDGLLVLARISRAELQMRTVDFTQVCREAADIVRAKHPSATQLSIAEGMQAYGDSRQLRALAEALLDNAFKFSGGHGEPKVRVGTPAAAPGTFVFSDNGIGFDMAYADKLFRPFQRLHADPRYAGLGIGLATVQRIVARHNGTVRIEASVDGGCHCFVTLPPPPK